MTYSNLKECLDSGNHLTDCDDSGYCNLCGYQEGTRLVKNYCIYLTLNPNGTAVNSWVGVDEVSLKLVATDHWQIATFPSEITADLISMRFISKGWTAIVKELTDAEWSRLISPNA